MTYRISEIDIEDVRRLKKQGLNQEQIARRLGVSPGWVSQLRRKYESITQEGQGKRREGEDKGSSGDGVLRCGEEV